MQHARHLFALCVLMTSSALAGSVSPAFTYQGQLTFNGSPASGNFDFKFDLYDAASGGVAIDSISQPALPVSSGLINTTLDYTSGPFNGQALWILVSVRPAGSGTYTALSPRQSINVTPYALFALQGSGGSGTLTLPFSGSTSTSLNALEVTNSGSGRGVYGSSTGGTGTGIYGYSTGGVGVWGESQAGQGLYGHTASPSGTSSGVIGFGDNGNGGVYGTSTGSGDGVSGSSSTGSGVYGTSSSGAGVWGDSGTFDGVHGHTANPSNNTSGVAGFGDGGNYGVFGLSTSGDGVHGGSTSNAGVSGGSSSGTGVYGTSSSGAGVWGDSGTFDGVHGHTANPSNSTSGVAGIGDSGNIGVYGHSDAGNAIFGHSYVGLAGYFYSQGVTVLRAAGPYSSLFSVESTGNVLAHGSFVPNGIDYADRLPAETGVEAADVVVIGEDGVLRRSTHANETDVAGVYSTRPGVLGQQEEETRATIPVALAGVVPVKVGVENGAIHPGDLLVSSSSPGRAMRAPSDPRPGTVIGKAMQRLENGEGQITMLVMLR